MNSSQVDIFLAQMGDVTKSLRDLANGMNAAQNRKAQKTVETMPEYANRTEKRILTELEQVYLDIINGLNQILDLAPRSVMEEIRTMISNIFSNKHKEVQQKMGELKCQIK